MEKQKGDKLMEKQFKVVWAGSYVRYLPMVEEATELTKKLAKMNTEIVEADCATEEETIKATKDADIILTTGPRLTRRVMEALTKCKAIIGGSVGFDEIDVDAATDNSIIVVNNPSYQWCVEEVSNQAITLLLACAKKLVFLNNLTKQGRWAEGEQAMSPMASIHGQTLGVIGCGSIGRMMARKAQCFRLKILGYDPYVDYVAKESGITLVSLPELLKEADFVSVHASLHEKTWHLMGEKEFKQMKPTAYFINTSRGSVVDEPDLIKALQEKRIAGAGLDVFEKEPVDSDNPLLKMDNVLVTPHSAGYSDAAYKRPRVVMLQEALKVLSGRWPRNVVNKGVKPKGEFGPLKN